MITEKTFMRVDDVAAELDISKSLAYKIVQKLNAELEEKGYMTVSGRVNRKFFAERFYCIQKDRGRLGKQR